MRAATVVQVLWDIFYVLLHVLFYLWSLLNFCPSLSSWDEPSSSAQGPLIVHAKSDIISVELGLYYMPVVGRGDQCFVRTRWEITSTPVKKSTTEHRVGYLLNHVFHFRADTHLPWWDDLRNCFVVSDLSPASMAADVVSIVTISQTTTTTTTIFILPVAA